MMGKPKTKEHILNMSKALKGRKFTKVWIQNIALGKLKAKQIRQNQEDNNG